MGLYNLEYFFGRIVGNSYIQNTFNINNKVNSLQIYATAQNHRILQMQV
jgi:hypothetical protein